MQDQIGNGDDRPWELIHRSGRASELSAQASRKKPRINRDLWLKRSAVGWWTPRSILLLCRTPWIQPGLSWGHPELG